MRRRAIPVVPALSILLPTHNGARFLDRQVESILEQTCEEFELLIVDDGSQDRTPELVAAWAARDARIRVLPSAGNLGHKRRLAELLAAARAALISIADQDDVWAPDKLALLRAGLGDADMAFGTSWLIDAEGRELGRTLLDGIPPPPRPGDRLTFLFKPAVSAHAMIARRHVLSPASFARATPFDWLQSLDAALAAGVVHVPAARTLHRIHGSNQMNGGATAVARRPRLQVLRPGSIKRHVFRRRAYRMEFMHNVEHLAASDIVPLATARTFERIYGTCRRAWYYRAQHPRWNDVALRDELVALLEPLAGGREDWAYAHRRICDLVETTLHPRSIADYLARPR